MCGILALISRSRPVEPLRVQAALARMAHRGPDGTGWISRWDGRLALGHLRLAIFDTGPDGAQPMIHPATGDAIVFNGSIYNFRELRAELEDAGHVFLTRTDTEVVLAAWRHWGAGAFERLNGTWALALHDVASDSLVISRDRLGVKPLYLLDNPDGMTFASEARAVLRAAGHRARINERAAFDFLTLGLSDHRGQTMLDGVVEVPPGALWRLARGGAVARGAFHAWPSVDESLTGDDVAGVLPDLLLDATALRLRSDVPVAAQLSGGMDSGTVAWAIGRWHRSITAPFVGFFTYGYHAGSAGELDETADAAETHRFVAEDTPLTFLRVDPTPSRPDLETFIDAQELPVNTPSPIAGMRLYAAMRAAGAKVVLTGDGGDEMFGGYTRRYVPVAIRDALSARHFGRAVGLARLPDASMGDVIARMAWEMPSPVLRAVFRRRLHVGVMRGDFWDDGRDRLDDLIDIQRTRLGEIGALDVTRTILPQILRFADRNSMHSGVESRSPFLDHRIADLAMRLPMAAKVGREGGKLPLRRAMASRLPPRVIRGAKCRGLGHAEQCQIGALSFSHLFRHPPESTRPFVDAAKLEDAIRRHPKDMRLWWPLCLLMWADRMESHWT